MYQSIIPVTEARTKFLSLVKQAEANKNIVLTRAGRPIGGIVSWADLQLLQEIKVQKKTKKTKKTKPIKEILDNIYSKGGIDFKDEEEMVAWWAEQKSKGVV